MTMTTPKTTEGSRAEWVLSASAGAGTPVTQYFKVNCQTAQQELQEF